MIIYSHEFTTSDINDSITVNKRALTHQTLLNHFSPKFCGPASLTDTDIKFNGKTLTNYQVGHKNRIIQGAGSVTKLVDHNGECETPSGVQGQSL